MDGGKVPTDQQWAEVCFVPNWIGHSKKSPDYRFIAIREPLEQVSLPGLDEQLSLPFPTMELADKGWHKVFGVVTNRDLAADELIWWHRQRCGKSEEAHGVMKDDLAAGKLPSGLFGVNTAWYMRRWAPRRRQSSCSKKAEAEVAPDPQLTDLIALAKRALADLQEEPGPEG